ncbi:hypothetical protein ACVGWW_01600 [Enterobacter hormaechei]
MAFQFWYRLDPTVDVSGYDREKLVKNMVTILCEERVPLAHYRPTEIIKATFYCGS